MTRQAYRLRMEANRKAAKAETEASKQRMKQLNANVKLGKQSSCLFFITHEGN